MRFTKTQLHEKARKLSDERVSAINKSWHIASIWGLLGGMTIGFAAGFVTAMLISLS